MAWHNDNSLRCSSVRDAFESADFSGRPDEADLWLVGYITHGKVFHLLEWSGRFLQISEQKLYRNLIRSGGISRCGYQQKGEKGGNSKEKFLIS